MKIYLLWHTHELTDDFGTHDENKLIGVFSSVEKANHTIEKYKTLEGFKDYPLDCFVIDEYEIDGTTSWSEGFFTTQWTE